ncbi:hypothetical protein [Ferrovibrio terrae]|uniref:hypothetical protein n=1 Tax=Ferrovibrio terrae TaxID=2594003 RepID=UPI00313836FC
MNKPLDARSIKALLGPAPIWEWWINVYEIPARATLAGLKQQEASFHSTQKDAEESAAECNEPNFQHVALMRQWHDGTMQHVEIIDFDAEEERVRIERAAERASRQRREDLAHHHSQVL